MSDTNKIWQIHRIAEGKGAGAWLHGGNTEAAERAGTDLTVQILEGECLLLYHRLRNLPYKELILQKGIFNVAKTKPGSKSKNWNETGILFIKVASTTASVFCSRGCCANAIKCKKDGTGMKFEPPSIASIGDHLCSCRSSTGRLQTKEMFVHSSNYFTACLSSKMSRLNPSWVIEEITVLRTSRPLIDRFLVPSSVISLPILPLLMTSKLSPTFWLSRKLWQGKCQIMWSLLNFLTPSICFPTWVW